jgi:hypothetical protein
VSDATAEFRKLREICSAAALHSEGGKAVVLLPSFSFIAAGKDEKMDLLLHPSEHSGYITRLFFERPIVGRGKNWTEHRLLERNWWAPSYRDVAPSLPWPAMLCAHLRALA